MHYPKHILFLLLFLVIFIGEESFALGAETWGGYHWGMHPNQVLRVDPVWENRNEWEDGSARFVKYTKLYDMKFLLILKFHNKNGLDGIELRSNYKSNEKDVALKIFNAIKNKYGSGTSIEYQFEPGGKLLSDGVDQAISPAYWNIQHAWDALGNSINLSAYYYAPMNLLDDVSNGKFKADGVGSIVITYNPTDSNKF